MVTRIHSPNQPSFIVILALVFLIAGIQVFNRDETMDRYIERCWRIIQHTASKRDLENYCFTCFSWPFHKECEEERIQRFKQETG